VESAPSVALSFVIPVYNSSASIGAVVEDIVGLMGDTHFEVVLVNDGSSDDSEGVCARLVDKHPGRVRLVQLARNFSEHNAVLAGLNFSRGEYVAVLDDDGQNPPAEVLNLWREIKATKSDVVYGHYRQKMHGVLRNAGSRFNDFMANHMLGKPREIYLSSFKIMNRFTVDEIIKYRGHFPYIDGLIFRTTRHIRQIPVEHKRREAGRSTYTLRKLIALWLNMFLNFSITPLRLTMVVGFFTAFASFAWMVEIIVEKIRNPAIPVGLPSLIVTVSFFSGVQLLIIGMVGEYLGRLFLDHSGTPQYAVRYVKE
jgi:undecaprenyl-phosphate 4-deoxy-4-formamido-L-arabinose transferase